MSLSQRTPLRPCGKRYPTEDAARCSKKGLQAGAMVIPCAFPQCGGWHVALPKAAAVRAAKPPRCTGPDRLTRETVLERDGYACVCCGRSVLGQRYSLQHRQRRSQGGTSCTCNLLTVLGDGTRGHHFRIDSRKNPEDEARGYTVRSGQDPAAVSVMVFDASGGGASMFPTCDGEWSTAAPEGRDAA